MSLVDDIKSIQRACGAEPDGVFGPVTAAAVLRRLRSGEDAGAVGDTPALLDDLTILRGDGTWPFSAHVDGDDIVVACVTGTCFGGSNDPMDSGETASGISTKHNPTLKACALPMIYTGSNKALRKALGGSPIPKLPWNTKVEIMAEGKRLIVPVIDLGPAKRTGDAIDLTVAAARFFNPRATANNFMIECSYRIIGGAKYLTGKGSVL